MVLARRDRFVWPSRRTTNLVLHLQFAGLIQLAGALAVLGFKGKDPLEGLGDIAFMLGHFGVPGV